MKQRSSLGPHVLSVLDAALPDDPAPVDPGKALPRPPRPRRSPAPPSAGVGRTSPPAHPAPSAERVPVARLPTMLPLDVLERARRASYWTPGMSLARLVAEAIAEKVDRMERQRGEPFPDRGELKRGRPLG